jgi:hypothetical protein
LFDLVRPDALYERPIPERHRIVFYLGHLEAFDRNLLGPALDLPAFHPSFDRLFSFGIDPESGDLPTDRPSDWPAEAEVREYNARVRGQVDAAIAQAPDDLMHVAIEHRLMHAETFAYMLHQLPRGSGHAWPQTRRWLRLGQRVRSTPGGRSGFLHRPAQSH